MHKTRCCIAIREDVRDWIKDLNEHDGMNFTTGIIRLITVGDRGLQKRDDLNKMLAKILEGPDTNDSVGTKRCCHAVMNPTCGNPDTTKSRNSLEVPDNILDRWDRRAAEEGTSRQKFMYRCLQHGANLQSLCGHLGYMSNAKWHKMQTFRTPLDKHDSHYLTTWFWLRKNVLGVDDSDALRRLNREYMEGVNLE